MPLSDNTIAQYCDQSQYAIAGKAAGYSYAPTMSSPILPTPGTAQHNL